MPGYRATIGAVELVSLTDSYGEMDPLQVFPDSTIQEWREYPDLLNGNNHIPNRIGATAIRSEGKLIIVDTGLQEPGGKLLDEMSEKGVVREEVDIVVMTHLHADHVGWNLTNGQPTFPNARYLVPKSDWDYWTDPSVLENAQHVQDQVTPLHSLSIMDLMEGEYRITDELTAIPTPGHTPGHVSVAILSAGQRGFILGDVAHNAIQAHHTDWSPIFDIDADQARKTRHQVMDRLESEASMVYAVHFPEPGLGRFVRRNGRRLWQGF